MATLPPPPTGSVNRTSWPLTLIVIVLSCFSGFHGVFTSERGSKMMAGVYTSVTEDIIQTPIAERGILHQAKHLAMEATLSALFYAHNYDKSALFTSLRDSYGSIFPYRNGVAVTSHKDVIKALENPSTTTSLTDDSVFFIECLDTEVLGFLSYGNHHKRERDFLYKTIDGLAKTDTLYYPGSVPTPQTANNDEIKSVVAANVLRGVFGEEFPEDFVHMAAEYYTTSASCAKRNSHGNSIRKTLLAAAKRTALGKELRKQAKTEGFSQETVETLLSMTVDGVLFAGVHGTGQLAIEALTRLRFNPKMEVPRFKANPSAYIQELERLSPIVHSLTHTYTETTQVVVGATQKKITLPAGSRKEVILSTANVDRSVFGGPSRVESYALSLDQNRANLGQYVTWYAPKATAGTDYRWSVAHDLSHSIVERVLQHFVPRDVTGYSEDTAMNGMIDTAELDRLSNSGSALTYLIAAVFIIIASRGPVAMCFFYITVGILLNRVGMIMDVEWLEKGAIFLEAFAMTIFSMLYLKTVDLKGHISYLDVFNVFVRTSLPFTLMIYIYVNVGPEAAAGVPDFVEGVAKMMLISTLYRFWRQNGWAWQEMFGMLIAVVVFFPTLFVPKLLSPTLVSFAKAVFEGVVGLPYLCLLVLHLDNCTPESLAALKGEKVTEHHRKEATAFRLQKDATQRNMIYRGTTLVVVLLAVLLGVGLQKGTLLVADGNLCPFGAPSAFEGSGLCENSVLRAMDVHTRFMYVLTHYLYTDAPETIVPPTAIGIPTDTELHKTYTGFGGAETLAGTNLAVLQPVKEASMTLTKEAIMAKVTVAVHQYMNSLPLTDLDEQWDSIQLGKDVMALAAGEDLPASLTHWDEMESDEAITRFCFAGIAAHRIEVCSANPDRKPACPKGAKYFVDLTFLYGLKVRVPFERYGAATYFDENRKLIGMYWSQESRYLLPDDEEWGHVKWAFKCSAILGITAIDHLVGVHFLVANIITTASRSKLGINHPFRRLLDIHTYNTIEINAAATRTLAVKGGLVHHASALTDKSLMLALEYGVKVQRAGAVGTHDYAKSLLDSGLIKREEWEFGSDYVDFYHIIEKFVIAFTDILYETDEQLFKDAEILAFHDALHFVRDSQIPYLQHDTAKPGYAKRVLAKTVAAFILGATGTHNHAGMVSEYLKDPTFAAAKIRVGETHADVQSSFQCMNIAMLTGFKAPMLLGDYSHMFEGLDKYDAIKKAYDQFQSEMVEFSGTINARNAKRKFPCNAFDPARVLSSVSI